MCNIFKVFVWRHEKGDGVSLVNVLQVQRFRLLLWKVFQTLYCLLFPSSTADFHLFCLFETPEAVLEQEIDNFLKYFFYSNMFSHTRSTTDNCSHLCSQRVPIILKTNSLHKYTAQG